MMKLEHKELLKKIQGTTYPDGSVKQVGVIDILKKGNFPVSKYFIESSYKTERNNKTYKCYNITKKGCQLILDNTRKNSLKTNQELLNFAYDNKMICYLRPEISFINLLEETLKAFNIKGIKQYNVLSYRIDYYLPELNIAIEYDEGSHKKYTYEQHEGRQEIIEEKLGCRFIRITNKNTDAYNVGYVIKQIFNL